MSRRDIPEAAASRDWMDGLTHEANPYPRFSRQWHEYQRRMNALLRQEHQREQEKSHVGI